MSNLIERPQRHGRTPGLGGFMAKAGLVVVVIGYSFGVSDLVERPDRSGRSANALTRNALR